MDNELYCIGALVVYVIFLLVTYSATSWFHNGWFLFFVGLIGIVIMGVEHMILKNKDMIGERIVHVEKN